MRGCVRYAFYCILVLACTGINAHAQNIRVVLPVGLHGNAKLQFICGVQGLNSFQEQHGDRYIARLTLGGRTHYHMLHASGYESIHDDYFLLEPGRHVLKMVIHPVESPELVLFSTTFSITRDESRYMEESWGLPDGRSRNVFYRNKAETRRRFETLRQLEGVDHKTLQEQADLFFAEKTGSMLHKLVRLRDLASFYMIHGEFEKALGILELAAEVLAVKAPNLRHPLKPGERWEWVQRNPPIFMNELSNLYLGFQQIDKAIQWQKEIIRFCEDAMDQADRNVTLQYNGHVVRALEQIAKIHLLLTGDVNGWEAWIKKADEARNRYTG